MSTNLDNVSLPAILRSLSDPTRLEIISRLAEAGTALSCDNFNDLGKKSNLSQHYRNLRENGLVTIQRKGRHAFLELRVHALNQHFPGLLEGVISAKRASQS
ncbi:ArsR family transcriptional regulator [Lacticaseibacillus rhamnosus]|nr:ArsR family transcriptional regulator [Lacticaseibacillus rhamnosus]